jgi:hypothetical protein
VDQLALNPIVFQQQTNFIGIENSDWRHCLHTAAGHILPSDTEKGQTMKITMANLQKFVRKFDGVSIVDSTHKTYPLKDGGPDIWAMIEKAETFKFQGVNYSRAEFEKVLDAHL